MLGVLEEALGRALAQVRLAQLTPQFHVDLGESEAVYLVDEVHTLPIKTQLRSEESNEEDGQEYQVQLGQSEKLRWYPKTRQLAKRESGS